MCLLKGLAHAVVFQPATPAQDGLHVGPNGMPHPYARLRRRLDGVTRPIHQAPLPRNGRRRFAVLFELPDETRREMRDHPMIEIQRLPTLEGGRTLRDQLAL